MLRETTRYLLIKRMVLNDRASGLVRLQLINEILTDSNLLTTSCYVQNEARTEVTSNI